VVLKLLKTQFDVVKALQGDSETASVPILVITAKQITAQDRAVLNGAGRRVIHVVEKAGSGNDLLIAEIRRTLQSSSGRA